MWICPVWKLHTAFQFGEIWSTSGSVCYCVWRFLISIQCYLVPSRRIARKAFVCPICQTSKKGIKMLFSDVLDSFRFDQVTFSQLENLIWNHKKKQKKREPSTDSLKVVGSIDVPKNLYFCSKLILFSHNKLPSFIHVLVVVVEHWMEWDLTGQSGRTKDR